MGQYLGSTPGNGSDIERWGFYNAYDFKFPSESELKYINAIIIPGSDQSVREADNKVSWVSALKSFILRVYNDHPHVKIFGVGFGSQITAEALGGTVEKMNFGRIFIGKESIEMKKNFFQDNKFVAKVLEDICTELNVDKTALEG